MKKTFSLIFFCYHPTLKEVFGTDLEQLKGKRKGQHSIRVNDQYRICFVWEKWKVYELELVDYHGERK